MNPTLIDQISRLDIAGIPEERKTRMAPLVEWIREKQRAGSPIRLQFICTHNSRRSHLAQVWAQCMAAYYKLEQVSCYSGGTEATAVYPKIIETLEKQGFAASHLGGTENPVYALKYAKNEAPVICFSKTYSDPFNPVSDYAAILTCRDADENCPVVRGASARFPLSYEDPKIWDNTENMDAKYEERSLEIAREMGFIFSQIQRYV